MRRIESIKESLSFAKLCYFVSNSPKDGSLVKRFETELKKAEIKAKTPCTVSRVDCIHIDETVVCHQCDGDNLYKSKY